MPCGTVANHLVGENGREELLKALALETREGGANAEVKLGACDAGLRVPNK